MGLTLRFVSSVLLISCPGLTLLCRAQQSTPPAPTQQPAATTTAPQAASTTTVQQSTPPPQEPYIIEDGGFSIEPIYWLNRAQPSLWGGASDTAFSDMGYPGHANPSLGGEIGIPAGRSNTLRISYFRVGGNSNTTETASEYIFGESYSPGDFLVYNYLLQSAKLSWDYLGYTWYKPSGKIRLKTLYEVQFVTVSTNFSAPFKAVTTDSSGNTDYNTASGSRNLIDPTFGLELEEALGHHFRWEVKASGFGIPHHADIWDAEGSVAFRLGNFEVLAGEKAFHFKDSPQATQYFADTLSGAYIGLRYYWRPAE